MKTTYLDHNATTPIDPEVLEAMMPYLTDQWGNPSSTHTFGARVKRALDAARENVAALIGADSPSEIIFTGCGTESNNMAIRGGLDVARGGPRLVTTAVEHAAVLEPARVAEERGTAVTRLSVNEQGALNLDELKEAVDPNALTSIMWANNETGVLFPIPEIGEIVKERGGVLHSDAIQVVGKLPVDLSVTPVDMLSLSGHKLNAPKGVGALYVRRGTKIAPLILGGSQERVRRAGTENVPFIVGLGKACELAKERMETDAERERALRDRLEEGVLAACPTATLNGAESPRLPNTSNIGFAGLEGESILLMLDDVDICASAGSACESGSLEASHVLKAMNVPRNRLMGSIRFSLGRTSTEEDVDALLERLPPIIERLTALSPSRNA